MASNRLRICIDLDGTICSFRKHGQTYEDVEPLSGAKEIIDSFKEQGHTIIIHTARNMQSQGHNVGKVLKNIGKVTLDWLDRYGIQYDEIYFGKPNADITIDDRTFRFEGWAQIDLDLIQKLAKKQ